MTEKEATAIVRTLPTSPTAKLTDGEKKKVRRIIKEFGIEGVTFSSKCPNCWHDAVILLRNRFGVSATPAPEVAADKKWRYTRANAVTWNGKVIDANTPDDVLAEFARFFPQLCEEVKEGEK